MSPKSNVFSRAAALAGAAALLLVSCGDDDETSGRRATGDPDLTVIGYDTFEFDEEAYTVAAGEVTIGYENAGSIVHTLVIDESDDFPDFELRVISEGDTDAGTVELEPGEYRIWCDEPGHTPGMEATLTVE